EIYLDLLLFKKAILGFDISADSSELERIICQNEPYCISHLKISGKDLELKGIKGEKIGQTLENLRREVCKHPEYNTKEKLIKMISN
ncbi:MAG: hypothetical protein II802_03850, partial [Clostridia bacterium]|nr:hypothetical protein [Clostridia bacterium]